MQAQARQGFAPLRFTVVGAGDEVEHRQQRFAAGIEYFQLVAVLGQHRLAGVDHIQPGVAGQQLAQYLGFLFEALACFAALQEAFDARRAIEAFAWAVQAFQVVEQGDGVFQAGGVVELQQRFAINRQACALDMASGAGPVRDFAETHVAGESAQQRGLADVGVADHG